MQKVLVTGGAGYIGSVTVSELQKKGYEVVVFDNLVYGHKEAVNCKLIEGDLLNKEDINAVFKKYKFDGVIHFAAYALAGESMDNPAKYFENNLQGGLNLLEAMKYSGVNNIIFSSSCSIHGYPKKLPVKETSEKTPVSVYGESKLMCEKILNWYDKLFGIKNICLRYFNASGATIDGKLGEDHKPETHLIPIVLQCALGLRDKVTIFGDDYSTPDGTNVRDYIHVMDLAQAHIKALDYLWKAKKSDMFNVGTGKGYSNKDIVETVKRVTKKNFKVVIGKRREGDPDEIYADNNKIKKILGWKPEYSNLDIIIESAWKWHKSHPNGWGN